MTPDSIQIDELILYSFPYPVAIDYYRLLGEPDKRKQTDLALNIFAFSIRSMTLTLLIRYLANDKVNSQKLNEEIRERLPVAQDHDWIQLLRLTLETYHNHDARDDFFMFELYDLYVNSKENQTELSIWDKLERLAKLGTERIGNRINPEQIADELHELLRTMFRQLDFFANYEIWKIIEVDEKERYVYYERFQGVDTILQDAVTFAEIKDVNPKSIKPGTYYIADGYGRLLQLDPLIVTQRFLDYDYTGTTSFMGLLNQFITDERSVISIIEYMLFATEIRIRTTTKTTDNDLLAKLNFLYVNHLNKKMEALRTIRSITWENICEELKKHNIDALRLIKQKYTEEYYVERDAITKIIDEFISNDSYTALVITGDAGVGKTNLLYHSYHHLLSNQRQYATLWLDGSDTNFQVKNDLHANSIVYWMIYRILEQLDWKAHFNIASLPSSPHELEQIMSSIFQQFFIGNRKLVILIDAINENGKPYEALTQVATFINRFYRYPIKIVLTSRPHVWKHFKETCSEVYNQVHFYGTGTSVSKELPGVSIENDSFLLKRFTEDEMYKALALYASYFNIRDINYESLNEDLKNMLFDPLHLRFFCEANKGQRIRPDYEPNQIIPDLIMGMINDKRLEAEYINQFLVQDIIPLFVPPGGEPVNEISSNTLSTIYRDGFSLRDYVVGEARFADDQRLNAPFLSLKRAGLIYESGIASNFKLKFRYEYFYDYFVGRHLVEHIQQQDNKIGEIERLVAFLDKDKSFLWGPIKHLLRTLLQSGMVQIIDRLAQTDSAIQRDLLTSVISENFVRDHHTLRPLIRSWLEKSSESNHKAQIAVSVAVSTNDREFLVDAITHRNSNIRALAIQRIYELWEGDRETALSCLQALADSIRLYKLARNADFIETLIIGIVTIVTLDYYHRGYNHATLLIMQKIIKPVIQRLFWLLPSRRLRRLALRIVVGRATVILQKAEGAGQTIISVEDAKAFFPASEEDREIILRLVHQIDAAADPNVESLETLVPFLKHLVTTKQQSYVIAIIGGLIVMLAHFFRDYEETVEAIQTLFQEIKNVCPPTDTPKNPTASPWVFMLNWTLSNGPYREMNIEVANRVLSAYKDLCLLIEEDYWATAKLEYHDRNKPPMRISVMADPIVWAYQQKLDWRYDLVKEIVNLAIRRQDWEQIQRYVFHMTEMAPYNQLGESGLDVILDIIRLIRAYEKTHVDTVILDKPFWDMLEKRLSWSYATNHKLLRAFLYQLGEDAPSEFHQQIKAMQPREDTMMTLVNGVLLFGRQAMRDTQSDVLRNFVKYIILQLLDTKDLQQFGTDLIVYLSNTIYGDTLFAVRKKRNADYDSESV